MIKIEDMDKIQRVEILSRLNCTPEELVEKYNKYKLAEIEFNSLYEPFKQNLLELYEKDPDLPKTILFTDMKLIHVAPSVRTTLDSKKLKEEEPAIAKKFTKTTNVGATIKLDKI